MFKNKLIVLLFDATQLIGFGHRLATFYTADVLAVTISQLIVLSGYTKIANRRAIKVNSDVSHNSA